jgi:hypothetical protein
MAEFHDNDLILVCKTDPTVGHGFLLAFYLRVLGKLVSIIRQNWA